MKTLEQKSILNDILNRAEYIEFESIEREDADIEDVLEVKISLNCRLPKGYVLNELFPKFIRED